MTEADAKEAISARWILAWGAAAPGAPIALANEAATPPAGAELFSTLGFGALQERALTLGTIKRYETRGIVAVRLFGPVDAGEAQLAVLASAVRGALAGQTIAELDGHALIGEDTNTITARLGGWWTSTVTVAFRFYDRR